MIRTSMIVAAALLLLAQPPATAQQPSAVGDPAEKPVWKASQLGKFLAERMAAPVWDDVADAALPEGVEPQELRLQLQVIEAHAAGQALQQPFQPAVARDAYREFFETRFPLVDQGPIRLGLERWGAAYSGAVSLGRGDEAVTLGHIRHVFANSLEVDETTALSARGPALWSSTVSEVAQGCQAAIRQAIVVPDN